MRVQAISSGAPRIARVKAIRTFTVRPVLADSLAPLDRLASNWRWSWSRATHALFASMDPALWDEIGENPARMLGALGQDSPRRARRTTTSSSAACAPRTSGSPPTSTATAGSSTSRATSRRTSPTSRPEFGVDGSLPQYSGRPRHPRGRPPQERVRPGRAAHRRRPLLPRRLLPPVDRRRRLAARELPAARPLRPRPHAAARRRRRARRDHARPAGRPPAARPRVGRRHRPHPAAAARLRDAVQHRGACAASPTASTAAAASTACCRSCCSASAASAPCARSASSPAARRPTSTTRTRGTPGSRASSGCRELITQDGLDVRRGARRRCAPGTVFTTHTPVPAGIDRFPRDLDRRLPRERPVPGPRRRADAIALGLETYEGGDQGVFNMAVLGLHLGQHANGVSRAARRGQPRHVRRCSGRVSTPTRCRSRRSPTACTRRPGCTPRSRPSSERAWGDAHTDTHDWTDRRPSPTASCGASAPR